MESLFFPEHFDTKCLGVAKKKKLAASAQREETGMKQSMHQWLRGTASSEAKEKPEEGYDSDVDPDQVIQV